ncbi:MAG: hypothetical protein HUU21_29610 [Polyangiaceae bacterium]|nr:hypothetical protein [Polyangiaceae bacterium]
MDTSEPGGVFGQTTGGGGCTCSMMSSAPRNGLGLLLGAFGLLAARRLRRREVAA